MTLPLIYALQQVSASERKRIIRQIKRHSEEPDTIREVVQFVNQSGGLDYARKVMFEYREKAFEILHSFPFSPARESLEDLVNFVVDREK